MGEEGTYWFIGKVEALDDPLKLGRARVRSLVDHKDLDTEDLPWAMTLLPTTSASLSQMGSSPTWLEEGSRVFCIWLDGQEKQKALILGTMPAIPDMDDEKHDVHKLAREENPIQKSLEGPEPDSAYGAKYPDNKVVSTKSGHVIELDDTEGAERMHFYHKSGTYEEINSEGRRVEKTVSDYFQIITGDQTIHVKGKASVNHKGELTIDCDQTINITGKQVIINGHDIENFLDLS